MESSQFPSSGTWMQPWSRNATVPFGSQMSVVQSMKSLQSPLMGTKEQPLVPGTRLSQRSLVQLTESLQLPSSGVNQHPLVPGTRLSQVSLVQPTESSQLSSSGVWMQPMLLSQESYLFGGLFFFGALGWGSLHQVYSMWLGRKRRRR